MGRLEDVFFEDMTVCVVKAQVPDESRKGVGTWCSPKTVKPEVANVLVENAQTLNPFLSGVSFYLLTITLQILDLKSTSSYIATASSPVV
jgi:hypothetical protein